MLFTVPSRYWFTIGRIRYLALGRGRPCFPPDSACPAVLTLLVHPRSPAVAYGTLTRCGGPFQQPSADRQTPSDGPAEPSHQVVQPRTGIGGSLCHPPGLGSARFARRYSGPPVFSSGYSDVSIPPVPPGPADLRPRYHQCPGTTRDGLPHSEISGSLVPSTSPERFAAWARPSSAAGA